MQTGQHIYLSYLSTGEKTRHSWDFYHLGFALDLGILILVDEVQVCRSGVTGPPISGDHCAALAPLRDNVSAVVTPPPPRPAPAPALAGTPRQWGAGCDHGATETDAALALPTIQS